MKNNKKIILICFWYRNYFFKLLPIKKLKLYCLKLTIPQALQLCFFLIIVKGVPQSMHFWIDSIRSSLGCFRPISDSKGLNVSRPILSEDFFWYNSLIVWKRASNQSSFSARVLFGWKKYWFLKRLKHFLLDKLLPKN